MRGGGGGEGGKRELEGTKNKGGKKLDYGG